MEQRAEKTELLDAISYAEDTKHTESPTEEAKYSADVLKKIAKPVTAKRSIDSNDDIEKESTTISSICDINNPDWKTPGDRELRKIVLYDGLEETLYFTPNKYHHKKLFVSFTIDTVSIDSIHETFRMKFYLQFNWIPSESDYRSLYKAAVSAQKLNKPQILSEWVPEWIPSLEFPNALEIHEQKWRPHPLIPEKGAFRLAQYKKWGNNHGSELNAMYREYDFERIKWLCAELQCDVTFREEMELYSYPFDIQDLSCCVRIKSKDTINCTIFSLPNYFNADASVSVDAKRDKKKKHPSLVGSIDPSFSQLDEWDVENCLIEFEFKQFVLSLKLARRWKPVVLNTLLIMFLVSALSFTVFTVDFEDNGSRLELTMTLILTAVLFDTKYAPKPYLTYVDKYIFTCYGYLTLVMIENAVAGYMDFQFDFIMFWVLLGVFTVQHIVFISYAISVRRMEKKKIFMCYEEVKRFNKRHEIERQKFWLYEHKNLREIGVNKYHKCISLSGRPWKR